MFAYIVKHRCKHQQIPKVLIYWGQSQVPESKAKSLLTFITGDDVHESADAVGATYRSVALPSQSAVTSRSCLLAASRTLGTTFRYS